MPKPPCPHCKSESTGRSPSGDWCNECGWTYPGLHCNKCGRKEVDIKHKALDETRSAY